jgi:hypothetical protein
VTVLAGRAPRREKPATGDRDEGGDVHQPGSSPPVPTPNEGRGRCTAHCSSSGRVLPDAADATIRRCSCSERYGASVANLRRSVGVSRVTGVIDVTYGMIVTAVSPARLAAAHPC